MNEVPRRLRPKKPRNARPDANIDELLPLFDTGGSAYFGYRMALAAKLFDRQIQRILEREGNLTLPQWRVLSQLGLRTEASVRMLAEGAAVDRAEASRAANQLVAGGLVERRDNPADARSPLFSLTAAGTRAFQRHRQPLAVFIARIVSDTEPADLLAANRVLRVVATHCLKGISRADED